MAAVMEYSQNHPIGVHCVSETKMLIEFVESVELDAVIDMLSKLDTWFWCPLEVRCASATEEQLGMLHQVNCEEYGKVTGSPTPVNRFTRGSVEKLSHLPECGPGGFERIFSNVHLATHSKPPP